MSVELVRRRVEPLLKVVFAERSYRRRRRRRWEVEVGGHDSLREEEEGVGVDVARSGARSKREEDAEEREVERAEEGGRKGRELVSDGLRGRRRAWGSSSVVLSFEKGGVETSAEGTSGGGT